MGWCVPLVETWMHRASSSACRTAIDMPWSYPRTRYMFDIVYVLVFLQVVTIFSDYFWLLGLAVRNFPTIDADLFLAPFCGFLALRGIRYHARPVPSAVTSLLGPGVCGV